jgi:acyl-CoA reductase-like NAD-dependent aldehyde dehydrogenase
MASIKRLYLHSDIYDSFLTKLVQLTKELKQGIPTEPGVDIGAMVNEEQLNIVDKMVKIGVDEGAKVLTGGQRNPNLKGYFYEPTILANATNDMKVVQEEIFGPVLFVLKFTDINEVTEMVNNNQYGLTSCIWTKDVKFGQKIAEDIDTGTVMVNEVVYTFALASTPWGGTKNSGIGRSHGKLGFYDVARPLHINIDQYEGPDLWWMPYDKNYQNLVENFKIIANSLVVKNLDD